MQQHCSVTLCQKVCPTINNYSNDCMFLRRQEQSEAMLANAWSDIVPRISYLKQQNITSCGETADCGISSLDYQILWAGAFGLAARVRCQPNVSVFDDMGMRLNNQQSFHRNKALSDKSLVNADIVKICMLSLKPEGITKFNIYLILCCSEVKCLVIPYSATEQPPTPVSTETRSNVILQSAILYRGHWGQQCLSCSIACHL